MIDNESLLLQIYHDVLVLGGLPKLELLDNQIYEMHNPLWIVDIWIPGLKW